MRPRWGLALGLALLAAPAVAQDRPLTTLMRPQPLSGTSRLGAGDSLSRSDRLFGERSLSSADPLAGEDSLSGRRAGTRGKPGETAACETRSPGQPRAGRAAATGSSGSGPGEYGRFVDNGRTPTKPVGAGARMDARAMGDRPLVGGTERPLWGDAPARGTPTSPTNRAATTVGEARDTAAVSAPAPAGGADRPLWELAGPARESAVETCSDAGDASTQTLFFKMGPAR